MAGQLTIDERMNIEFAFLKNYSERDIAKKTGRSIGTVHNVVADFREGRGTEPEAPEYLNEMVILGKFAKEHGLSVYELEEMIELTAS